MATTLLAKPFLRPVSVVLLAALLALAVSAGCGKTNRDLPEANVPAATATDGQSAAVSDEPAADKSAPADVDPQQLLSETIATYQRAKSYEDAGELHIDYVDPEGQSHASPVIPFSVALERPNKIRVHALQASIVGTGEKLYASIDSLRGQVMVHPDPEKLTLEALVPDSMLADAMRGQLGVPLPQLELLLSDDPIRAIVGEGAPKMLSDEELEGKQCHRVAVQGPHGTGVLWIDVQSKLVLKVEFPSDEFSKAFNLAEATIAAVFKGAEVDSSIDSAAFQFDVPENAKLLTRFLPPPPEPPSPMLGKMPEEFSFADFRGGDVTQQSLEGKVVVLDMWATWCGWCFEGFPNLQQVYDEFADNDKVAILAVNTDEVTVSDEKVRQAFETAKLTIPIVRDTQRAASEVFQVQGLPTMVILGAEGSVEDYHVGYDANLANTLPKKLERLLAGESLAKEELEKYESSLAEYEAQEAEALAPESNNDAD